MKHILFIEEMVDEASRKKVIDILEERQIDFEMLTNCNAVSILHRGDAVRIATQAIQDIGYTTK